MPNESILNITFNELLEMEIESLIKEHSEIHVELTKKQYKSLKALNERQLKYEVANSINKASFSTFILAVKWGWSLFRNSEFMKLRSLNNNISVIYPKSHNEKIELKLNEKNT